MYNTGNQKNWNLHGNMLMQKILKD